MSTLVQLISIFDQFRPANDHFGPANIHFDQFRPANNHFGPANIHFWPV